MRLLALTLVGMALAGCDKLPKAEARERPATARASSEFPKAGDYHIIRDRDEGGQMKREEVDMWVDASNREALEELVAQGSSRCRDRQVEIGGGSFSVRMTCDAPDGDIHNIGMESHGSYSPDSIDINSETTLWGMHIRESASYRLKDSGQ